MYKSVRLAFFHLIVQGSCLDIRENNANSFVDKGQYDDQLFGGRVLYRFGN